jgi:integrase/recombinase XerD
MEAVGFSQATVSEYLRCTKYFIEFAKGSGVEGINDVTKEVAHQYQMHLYGETNKTGGKRFALSTQQKMLITVKSFFKYLVKRGYMINDPTTSIELPKVEKYLPRTIMTKKEVFKLLDQPDADTPQGLRDKAILELLYSTGIRNSELRNLMVYDVDIENSEVRINQGKGRQDRILPLGEITSKYIVEYLNTVRPCFTERRERFIKRDTKIDGMMVEHENNLLFFGWHGAKLTKGGLALITRKHLKESKIKKHITPHSLRHTFATHMLKGKASIRHIQEMLGHKRLASTQIYTHVELSDLKQVHKKCHPREQDR